MRILFLAPWFRTLANIWARELREAGCEVLVVSSPMHFEPLATSPDELLLTSRPRSIAGVREFPNLRRVVRAFAPDVVVTEELRDPRLLHLAKPDVPVVLMKHDVRPHDATHRVPMGRRLTERLLRDRLAGVVMFSSSEARRFSALGGSSAPVMVIPLPSEMPDDDVPALVPAGGRRDFFCVGRVRPYKNLPTIADAWAIYVESDTYRGDTLRILGDGELDTALPPRAEWVRGTFRFADVAGQLAAGKGSIALYRSGSQSGAQVLSLQVGCAPIVSTAGGLAEYQPAELPPLDPDDVDGLVARLGQLSDPAESAALGTSCRGLYQQAFCASVSARALRGVLEELVQG